MKLKNITKEELETMSYSDIAQVILNEKGKSMKIVDIFREICKLLDMSDNEFEQKITDFFELITTDKNFIILDKGFCDLRKKHNPEVIIEEDDEEPVEAEVEEEDSIEEEVEDSEEDIYYDNSSDEDDVDDADDELNDFIVIDDEEASM